MARLARLYHGTSDRFLEDIRRRGLQPRGVTGISAFKRREASVPNWVYLATTWDDAAAFATRTAGKFGGEPVVVEVEVSEANLVPDEDTLEMVPVGSRYKTKDKDLLAGMTPGEARAWFQKEFERTPAPILLRLYGLSPEYYWFNYRMGRADAEVAARLYEEGRMQEYDEFVAARRGPRPSVNVLDLSIERHGSVAHVGPVPPESIVSVRPVTEEPGSRYTFERSNPPGMIRLPH